MPNKQFKSGFVCIIGRPNVGKSTLLNQILKQKVVIVSPKAQTTRNKIQGIYTTDEEQIIFIDTPGIHKAKNEFAFSSLSGADLIVYVIDATTPIGSGDEFIIEVLQKVKIPIFLVANKVDLVDDTNKIVENINSYKMKGNFTSGIPSESYSYINSSEGTTPNKSKPYFSISSLTPLLNSPLGALLTINPILPTLKFISLAKSLILATAWILRFAQSLTNIRVSTCLVSFLLICSIPASLSVITYL